MTVITALVAGTCGGSAPSSSPGSSAATRPSASPATSSAVPSKRPTSGATTTPAASDDAWAGIELPPLATVASLEATKGNADGIVAADTAFKLTSLDGTPVKELVKRLDVEPELDLRAGTPSGSSVVVRSAARLRAGQPYHFTLRREDGSIARTWTVTAATALHVVGTIPGDESSDVPRNTGIEVTFDQSGVTGKDVQSHFSIRPKVAGRFEVHGRVVAFVPKDPLKALTLYTVTIAKGLPIAGTGQTLKQDVIFRFETAGKSTGDRLHIDERFVDTPTGDAPVVSIGFWGDDDEAKVPSTVAATVHRLPGLAAATAAHTRLMNAPDWAVTGGAPIATGNLDQVLKGSLRVQRATAGDEESMTWVALPDPLPRGWYVLTLTYSDRREQALLQVTDLATYAMVSTTRTVAWVNSVRSGDPVAGATLKLAGRSLGATGDDGLRLVDTPAAVTEAMGDVGAVYLTVKDAQGREMFVPISGQRLCYKCEWWASDEGTSDWWSTLFTDRHVLRQTDRANVWGVVRGRDGTVPSTVQVRLEAYEAWTPVNLPLLVATAKPASTGMFTATLVLEDLPVGDYNVVLRADGTDLGSSYVRVGPIVKPAYELQMTARDHAILSGTTIATDIAATFFDGTPVAGVDLRVSTEWYEDEESDAPVVRATTSVDGIATARIRVALSGDEGDEDEQWAWEFVGARPVLPEEADIQGETWVSVFRSTALLDADAEVDDGTLVMTGAVHDVDFERMDALTDLDWEADPRGDPRAGAKVRLTITELIPVRTKIGTAYDFITKTTHPVYDYSERRVDLGSRTVTTNAEGRFRTTLAVHGDDRGYEIRARYVDESGTTLRTEAWASESEREDDLDAYARLVGADDGDTAAYAVGDEVELTMVGGHPAPDDDRYLFTVASRGLRQARVQSGATFTTEFRSAWIPNAFVQGVRFTGRFYDVTRDPAYLELELAERALEVRLTSDKPRYEPGDTVTVAVRTLDADGDPVAATVVMRAIDEKLYAIGAAEEIDLLGSLYAWVGDGVLARNWSHQGLDRGDGEGDTTGGGGDEGDRRDFRDWLLFKQVSTNADGRATVSFKLSDDLTSWRVTASALDRAMEAGDASLKVPVGLAFFAEAALAPEYLVGDKPVLRVRGYGSGLDDGDTVTFTISGSTVGMSAKTVKAKAFAAASVALPALPVGTHEIRIAAASGQRKDVLVRTITVVDARATQARSWSGPLTATMDIPGGTRGFTTVVLADGGRGRVLPLLLSLTVPSTARGDDALAAVLARGVLAASFAGSEALFDATPIDLAAFQRQGGGLALLPYASNDLELSAFAAMVEDPAIDRGGLAQFLREISRDPESTRERRIVALAGLAALDQPVLGDIRAAAAATDIPTVERAWLALGALNAGDEGLAADLERSILRRSGERLGPWVRVKGGGDEVIATNTALLAIVAAGIGDPLAADMDAYLESHPPKDTLLAIQRGLAARAWAERTPGGDATATLRVDGTSRRISIRDGEPVWLTLTPKQRTTATLTPVSGSVVVAAAWEGPLDPDSLQVKGIASITRTVKPAGTIGIDDLVIVQYRVKFQKDVTGTCWNVTDMVPSGLAPVAGTPSWYDDEDGGAATTEGPWRVVGQRVDFCVSSGPTIPVLQYAARVVTPGSFRWEPTVIQSPIVQEWGMIVPATTVTVAAQ